MEGDFCNRSEHGSGIKFGDRNRSISIFRRIHFLLTFFHHVLYWSGIMNYFHTGMRNTSIIYITMKSENANDVAPVGPIVPTAHKG